MFTQFNNIDSALPQKLHVQWSMKLEDDDSPDRPDERDDGFWPSTNPDAAGYVGTTNRNSTKFKRAMEAAQDRFAGWENGHWNYVGVIAVADLLIPIGGNSFRIMRMQSAGLWGVESDAGDYLKEVFEEEKANLLSEIKSLGTAIVSDDFVQ